MKICMLALVLNAVVFVRADGGSGDSGEDSSCCNHTLALSFSLGYGIMEAKQGLAGDLAILYGSHSWEFGLCFMGAGQVNTGMFDDSWGQSGPRRGDEMWCLSALAGIWPFGRGSALELDGGIGWYWDTQWQGTCDHRYDSGIGATAVARILSPAGSGRWGGTIAYFTNFSMSNLLLLSFAVRLDLSSW